MKSVVDVMLDLWMPIAENWISSNIKFVLQVVPNTLYFLGDQYVHLRQITEVLWQQKHVFAPLEFGVTVNFFIILNTFSCPLSSYASVTGPTIHSPLAMKSFAYKHDCYCVETTFMCNNIFWPWGCVCGWSEICRSLCGFIFVKYKLMM
jgi:hypothetical protein